MSEARDDRGAGEPRPAGPVAGQGPSPSQAAGEGPNPTPPAGDAAGADKGSDAGGQTSDAARVEADLDKLLSERDEYLELAQRTKADFENYRKRMTAETAAALARGKAELAVGLLGVLDNLERALAAAEIDPGAEQAPEEPLAQGIALTYRELCGVLQQAGVEAVDPAGERFDPNLHEALSTQPADGAEAGTVVETVQKGYRLGEQLIRPARVVVAE